MSIYSFWSRRELGHVLKSTHSLNGFFIDMQHWYFTCSYGAQIPIMAFWGSVTESDFKMELMKSGLRIY